MVRSSCRVGPKPRFVLTERICKNLRLHVLTGNPDDLAKLQDPAVPASYPFYSTQILRRAFHNILCLDSFTTCANPELPRKQTPFSFPEGMSPFGLCCTSLMIMQDR